MVWIENLDTAVLSESVGARLKRRKLHASVVPASDLHASVLDASDLPVAASPVVGPVLPADDSVILISPNRQGALADLGMFSCYDPSAPYVVPHHSQVSLKGSKGPTQLQLTEALQLQNTENGLFGSLAALSAQFPDLKQTSRDLALSLVLSRASSTFAKYTPLVRNWEKFALQYLNPAYPAPDALFLIYLQGLKAEATAKGTKGSSVSDTVYAVDFAHKLRGLDRPGTEEAVKLLIGATKRALGRPVVKKTAILKSEVVDMLNFAVPDFDNLHWGSVRAALFAVLAFCLEARFDDLIDLCGDSFYDYGSYIIVFVEHRKMDQFRQGEFVPIHDTGDARSACALIRAVLAAIGPADCHLPIFRMVGTGSRAGTYLRTKALSYTRVRELVRALMESVGMDANRFGLHSFRSGAASHANAQPNIPARLKERHGGWAPGSTSAVGYVHETMSNALMVPQALGL